MNDDETLIISGLHVDRRLLEVQPIRRCDIVSCHGACCSHGVLVDPKEKDNILRHAGLIRPHLSAERQDERSWFRGFDKEDKDFPSGRCDATAILSNAGASCGQSCIFLLRDARCALQVAAVDSGMQRWALKPFFCALYPLVLNKGWLELDDGNELYLQDACRRHTVCVDSPLYVALKDECVRALGTVGYRQLHQLASQQRAVTREG
jgi:hypothetical protein